MLINKLIFLYVIFLTPSLVHSEQDLWVDVTHSLECKQIGYEVDNKCYFGPNDYQVHTFLTYEKNLWDSVKYPWLFNHGKSKDELDNNPYYRDLR